MNNEGFRKMVHDRDSSKQIARAAVEAEFQKRRKGKKRRNDDYSSDSDNDDRPQKKKSALQFRPSQVKGVPNRKSEGDKEDSDEECEKYRDRAKERRDAGEPSGDNEDNNVNNKGLDMTLVRQERERLRREKDTDHDDDEAVPTTAVPTLPSLEEAHRILEQLARQENPPDLPSELVNYVKTLPRQWGAVKNNRIECFLAAL